MTLFKTPALLVCSAFLYASCYTVKKSNTTNASSQQPTSESVDTAFLNARLENYRGSETRTNDIINTKLEVSFDWDRQYLFGKATLKIKPYFYPTSTLKLDAREMEIKEVSLMDTASNKIPLLYTYENNVITINLGRVYKNTEEYTIFINYISKPNELKKAGGGSAAITDDKGLYFINPNGKEQDKPIQIWTQGETQSNSVWFPTIDHPNERMTEEIYITVDKKYTTLSNGELVFSVDNGDDTRTDYWKMSLPHAPYLVMMAVGEFAIVKDKWRDKEVNYYVEKEYEPYAKAIFGNTPKMIEFFSNKLGVDFAWNKYSQVVVRDYVSGAMENTTSALFGEFMQRNNRELLDKNYENVVSHELFHEWFGDLVTCESWSNIPLNESFATYGEYLWEEYKYGRDAADFHSEESRRGYFYESQNKQVPLIRFYYSDREELFDAHSYNKGGQILHMLRKYVGDDAFFTSLKLYLETNKFSSVEVNNLRLAFEQVTGEDLNWFFNQWFLAPGHPELIIKSTYDASNQKQKVQIKQIQDFSKTPLFKIPLAVDIYANGKKQRYNVVLTKADSTFEFDVFSQPDLVNVDAEKMLLCKKTEQKTIGEWVFQYNYAPLYLDRKEALEGLLKTPKDSVASLVMISALNDKMWSIRTFAISNLKKVSNGYQEAIKNHLVRLAVNDTVAAVRGAAIDYLSTNYTGKDLQLLYAGALKDSSYAVMSIAIGAISKSDSIQALLLAKQYENEKNKDVLIMIADVYARYGNEQNHEFFEETINKIKGYSKASFIKYYGNYLKKINNDEIINTALEILEETAEKDKSNKWVANAANQLIKDLEARKTKQIKK